MAIDLLLAHIGRSLPSHINDCIALAKKYDFNIHLIVEKSLADSIVDQTINICHIEDIIDDRYKKYSIKNYDINFRDNFYTKTSARFILLDNYIKFQKLTSVFHIENDIALFDNLSLTQSYLTNESKTDTALIIDNPNRCVPSLIWLRNSVASNRLADFVYHNNDLDDMKNLARYFIRYRQNINNLPIVPFNAIDKSTNINFGNMFSSIHSVFDGAAIGQYLYGIDSVSNTSGFINETCIFDPSQFKIIFKNKEPYISYQNSMIKINNLHMHCKNLEQLL